MKIFYEFLLSLATSFFHYVLVMLANQLTADQLTAEHLSGCNRLSPSDI